MRELEEFLLNEDNLKLAYEVSRALPGAQARVLRKLWCELESELDQKLVGLEKNEDWSDTSLGRISRYMRRERGSLYWGLYYKYRENVHLAIEAADEIYYGVHCPAKNEAERSSIKKALGESGNETAMWPWLRYPRTRLRLRQENDAVIRLADREFRGQYVRSISDAMQCLCEKLSAPVHAAEPADVGMVADAPEDQAE